MIDWLRTTWRLCRRRSVRILCVLMILTNLLDVVRVRQNMVGTAEGPASGEVPALRVFIASVHWNNGEVLRSHWNQAVLGLVNRLGPKNVFVSVFESGSWDDSKATLRELDTALTARGTPHTVNLSDVTHLDEMSQPPTADGWVDTPRGRRELRRIPFLARLRNQGLAELRALTAAGQLFDHVLFLNDVVFTPDDALELLRTRSGRYAAACSLDFKHPPEFYDTFAMRDQEGHPPLMLSWPYFRARESRNALMADLPVPVASCWNGMVAMAAGPLVAERNPLMFRGIPDSLAAMHLEGSECCLIHADNTLSGRKGVYVNPRVRVGYDKAAYDAMHPSGHQEGGAAGGRHGAAWLSAWQVFSGQWENRLRRWTVVSTERWAVQARLRQWQRQDAGHREAGEVCLINEMHVLVDNGWAHV